MKVEYICEICGGRYPTEMQARSCEDQTIPELTIKPGDIVLLRAGFGWYNGDPQWVSNPDVTPDKKNPDHGNCFGRCCTYAFYYVVTHIENYNHRWRYHVKTDAMLGESTYSQGFTFSEHHYTPRLVKDPPEHVLREGKKHIGKVFKQLIH